ncbi:hypothetical protein D5R81_11780 [Parashewanella spongiae]|uniref:Uncharacterized protein n=1 Tax=Parashewanella spongiae TaxID=342950 RepID=A0A3A6TD28_9GAMM|nr:hypothetical protein [Parashewanella spongiae]MCL1078597.1 hypothetical protein [Parashewanella spongiae]RJY13103.1 hypothetical protein D5R81_11780 [Parashewanella spongiae]
MYTYTRKFLALLSFQKFGTRKRMLSFSVIACTAYLGLFGSQTLFNSSETAACMCESGIAYNAMLPANHPTNRCANQTKQLNWGAWFAGQGSNQFHFLDLVELLNRSKNQHIDSDNDNLPAR